MSGGIVKRVERLELLVAPPPGVAPLMFARLELDGLDASAVDAARHRARTEAAREGATLLLQEFEHRRFQRLQFVWFRLGRSAA